MTTSIVQQEIERLKAEINRRTALLPPLTQARYKAEKNCGDYILEQQRENIAKYSFELQAKDLLFIQCHVHDECGEHVTYTFMRHSQNSLDSISNQSLQESGCVVTHYTDLGKSIKEYKELGQIPILIKWTYGEEALEAIGEDILRQPMETLTSVKKPFQWAPEPAKKLVTKKPVRPLEKDLEADLLSWMHSRGIESDSQIQTSKHRMDLWIPGKCFLELKKGKVNGDDICQAIDYCAEYKLPVVLVGNHIGTMASRGIEAFNKAVDSDMVAFVQWSAVKTYLKGLIGE